MSARPISAGEYSSKPRYTRTEKRQFTREKFDKAGRQQQSRKPSSRRRSADATFSGLRANEVDAMIVRLLRIRDQAGNGKKTLESRVTTEVKAKKEKAALSPRKLKKIQKRREMRAEKRKLWLEKKTAEQSGREGASAVPAVASTFAPAPVEKQVFEEDEINFDEL